MKSIILIVASGFGLLVCGGGRADDPPPATLAVSREGTLYIVGAPKATLAVSREGTFYLLPPGTLETLAVSREGTIYLPPGALATLAISREGTMYLNYAARNVVGALRIAAGLVTPTPREMVMYNLVTDAPSATVVDVLDAYAVANRATHPPGQ